MKKDQLVQAIANEPDCLDIEVAVKGDKVDNILYRRIIGVERRHRKDIGRDVISLVCLKSLTEEKKHFAAEDKARREERKKIISDAALLFEEQAQREKLEGNEPSQDRQHQEQTQGQPKARNLRKKKSATNKNKGNVYDSAFDLRNFGKGTKKPNTFADIQNMVKENLERYNENQVNEPGGIQEK